MKYVVANGKRFTYHAREEDHLLVMSWFRIRADEMKSLGKVIDSLCARCAKVFNKSKLVGVKMTLLLNGVEYEVTLRFVKDFRG